MTKWLLFSLVLAHIILWVMGGSGVPPFKKGWRRFVLPILTAGLLFWVGTIAWWKVLLALPVHVVVNTLGYGEKKPLLVKVLVAAALGLPAVVLNTTLWFAPLWTLLHFGGYYWISKRLNWFSWMFAEMSAGFSQGTAIAVACLI